MTAPQRLVHTGNALVDVVLTIHRLPERGGDTVATSTTESAGGATNAMVAAARLGLPAVYAGAHGTGQHGDTVRRTLAAEGVRVLRVPDPTVDTGFVVALVDAAGERTFVTSPGAEARLDSFADLVVDGCDVVYVSGYSLAAAPTRHAVVELVSRLGEGPVVVVDPGPLVRTADVAGRAALRTVLARADWLTLNAAEAAALTGAADPGAADPETADPEAAAAALEALAPRAGVLVRLDRHGALLRHCGVTTRVPPVPVAAVDSNGAGDAHTGAFLAALADGLDPVDAVALANRAAAFAVTRRGPATGPTRAELAGFSGSAGVPDG